MEWADSFERAFFAPTFSVDGTTLYFEAENPKEIWMSHRTKDGWTALALFLDGPYVMYGFMPTKSGTYYVGSDPDAEDKKSGITFSFSTMNVSAAGPTMKSLGVPLNEPGYNGDFYVAPDESYMIVSAKETKTGECELYISFRKSNSTWSVPVSLGPKINDGLALDGVNTSRRTADTSSTRAARVQRTARSTGFASTSF
jgi:hypothetical protein